MFRLGQGPGQNCEPCPLPVWEIEARRQRNSPDEPVCGGARFTNGASVKARVFSVRPVGVGSPPLEQDTHRQRVAAACSWSRTASL